MNSSFAKSHHFLKNALYNIYASWLRNNLIHRIFPCLFYVLSLRVASTCNNHGLRQEPVFLELSNFFCRLITVHDGHTAIHED
jgi:hypothetical protein